MSKFQLSLETSRCAYRGNDDDEELLSLELFHRAHLNVRQAHLPQKNPNLLTLKTNQEATEQTSSFKIPSQASSNLLPVWGNDADVRHGYGVVQLLGQLAAVQHDLDSLHRVEPGGVEAFPHFCALKQTRAESPSP